MDRVQWHYLRLRMWPARGVDGADDHADGRMAGENLNCPVTIALYAVSRVF